MSSTDDQFVLIGTVGSGPQTSGTCRKLASMLTKCDVDATTSATADACTSLTIETKYYTASLRLFCTEAAVLSEALAERAELVILTTHAECVSDFSSDSVYWISCLRSMENIGTRVLSVFGALSSEAKTTLNAWCVEHSFELVELDPSKETREELEEYSEKIGVDRVLQIVESHPWSNMQMKDASTRAKPGPSAERLRELMCGAGSCEEKVTSPSEDANDSCAKHVEAMLEQIDNDADTLLRQDEDMEFEQLFARFASFKDRAAQLEGDERRAYAEKVAVAFWEAIGGDPEEVAGLSDEEEREDNSGDCGELDNDVKVETGTG